MLKLTLGVLFFFYTSQLSAQHDFLVFKKNNKKIASFWKGSYIAFQLKNHEWRTGYITKLQQDSLWIRPMVVYYHLMGTDTVRYSVQPYALSDINAMPKKGVNITYQAGRFQISRSSGHVHWYWIKSGWLFRVGGAGYATVTVVNGIIKDDLSLSNNKKELGFAAGSFLFGVLLKKLYKPTLPVKGKYHIEYINLNPVKSN